MSQTKKRSGIIASSPSEKKLKTLLENHFIPKHSFTTSSPVKPLSQEKQKIFINLVDEYNKKNCKIVCPGSFEKLKEYVEKEFNIPQQNLVIRNLHSTPLSNENFQSIKDQDNFFVLSKDQQLENSHEFVVDITPSKNILLKSGSSDYDVPSAIAELVDNAIQAVRNNPAGERVIQIRFKNQSLFIWDNGKGMNAEELKNWATMGISQSDTTDQRQVDSGFSDRGYISRFGVGAKRAAFFLGKTIQVCTKDKESKWVYQTCLSSETLKEYEDQWKTTLTVRAPLPKETTYPSFTLVKVKDLNFSAEDLESIAEELSHIYHYYIHG